MSTDPATELRRLHADCARCVGLCCVVPALTVSADFAIDKPAGVPCPNLHPDSRCAIHGQLRERGFPGCTAYDCFGAGQQVVQITFGGLDWRSDPDRAEQMFAAFPIMTQLHELLWYLTDARARPTAGPLHDELAAAYDTVEPLTRQPAGTLAQLDLPAIRGGLNDLLVQVSRLVRSAAGHVLVDRRRAELMGADLRGADLRCADLRGARLIRADLRGADLRWADLIGADLRGAIVHGADLTESLFLTQTQVSATTGDRATRLSPWLDRPSHWTYDEETR